MCIRDSNDPLEQVSTAGTALEGNATTFYVWVNAYSGDGTYTLRVWTNNSTPKPDMTISMVEAPLKAKAGDTVTVNYTVENLANNSTATTRCVRRLLHPFNRHNIRPIRYYPG